MKLIPRVIIALLLAAILLVVLSPRIPAEAGYWEPHVQDRVDRGYPLSVYLVNHDMPLAALTATVYDPTGENVHEELVPLPLVVSGQIEPRNWTFLKFEVETSDEWTPGTYRLELRTCNECVNRGGPNWTYLETSFVFELQENPTDIYNRLLEAVEIAEKGESNWPAYIIGAAFLIYLFSLYISVRIVKWKSQRATTSTSRSTVANVGKGLIHFNLAHDPRTWWNNKVLAKQLEKRRQLTAELKATEKAIKKRKGDEGIEDLAALGGAIWCERCNAYRDADHVHGKVARVGGNA